MWQRSSLTLLLRYCFVSLLPLLANQEIESHTQTCSALALQALDAHEHAFMAISGWSVALSM